MRIALDFRKSVEENASGYFERSKKAKAKIDGARKAIEDHKLKLETAREPVKKQVKKVGAGRKAEWFEKFHWFISSDGLLVIGGRDATSNEIVIKKHAGPQDLVFHTDMAGSPFVVVKNEGGGEVPEATREEAAQLTAVFSRGWKNGMATLPVFSARPEQVTKTPNPGESLPKGAFVIRGELTYYSPRMEYALGSYQEKVMGGPLQAVRKHCGKAVVIVQGSDKVSDVAKAVQKRIGGGLDEIIRKLPQNCRVRKD